MDDNNHGRVPPAPACLVDAAAFEDADDALGDLRSVTERVASLPEGCRAVDVTPWGATIAHGAHPHFAVLDTDRGGTVFVAVVLPLGHGQRSARRRAVAVAETFRASSAAEWRTRRFGEPFLAGPARLVVEGEPRWAVLIGLALPPGGDEGEHLRWASGRCIVEEL